MVIADDIWRFDGDPVVVSRFSKRSPTKQGFVQLKPSLCGFYWAHSICGLQPARYPTRRRSAKQSVLALRLCDQLWLNTTPQPVPQHFSTTVRRRWFELPRTLSAFSFSATHSYKLITSLRNRLNSAPETRPMMQSANRSYSYGTETCQLCSTRMTLEL